MPRYIFDPPTAGGFACPDCGEPGEVSSRRFIDDGAWSCTVCPFVLRVEGAEERAHLTRAREAVARADEAMQEAQDAFYSALDAILAIEEERRPN